MKFNNLFEKWGLTKLKFKSPIFEAEFTVAEKDKDAAWDMYVELLTRIATQPLENKEGVEKTALESIYKLFKITREIMHNHGRNAVNFTKIAVIVLNRIVRPFTANWHAVIESNGFDDGDVKAQFRNELMDLQIDLINYAGLLSEIAGVEDLTDISRNI
jgi:hypothetical protein